LALILAIPIILIYVLISDKESQSVQQRDYVDERRSSSDNTISMDEVAENQPVVDLVAEELITSTVVDNSDDSSPTIYPLVENPPFMLSGATGGRFVIRNRDGDVIRRGNEEDWVFSILPSPNEQLIVVGAGDGNFYVINSTGEKVIDLPQRPAGKNMLGMSSWHWLTNELLLGTSGLQKFDTNGNLISCCGGDNISESRMYVYDMNTNKMKQVQLPALISGKVLRIHKILNSGAIQVAHEDDEPLWIMLKK